MAIASALTITEMSEHGRVHLGAAVHYVDDVGLRSLCRRACSASPEIKRHGGYPASVIASGDEP
eukprot:1143981-Pelagomonas_calceolata.AAC.5